MNRHDEDWKKILDELPDSEKGKLVEAILKEAEGRKYPPVYYIFKAMSGEKDKELEDRLNKQAKKQYKEYLAADKWTCPQCGRQYHWQKNDEGRYAFCPKCQLATKTEEKA
jgi:rubrerythrin